MPIKVDCQSCGASMSVKDSMAGKRGKCPKCANMIDVPAAASVADDPFGFGTSSGGGSPAAAAAPASTGGWGQNVRTPMDDLLDEAGVKGVSTGPTCPNCAADIEPNAVLCVECGFNFAAGRQMRTQTYTDQGIVTEGMTETEKIMAKAERDIATEPIEFDEADHGDGPDSFLIALGMFVVFGLLVAIGIVIVVVLDAWTTTAGSFMISYAICGLMFFASWLWMTIYGFLEKIVAGLAMLAILPLNLIGSVCYIVGTVQGNIGVRSIGGIFALLALGLMVYMWAFGFQRLGALWIPLFTNLLGFLGMFAINVLISFGWV